MTETRERILDAAERLFAQQGYSGTSLRTIIAEAQVNLAAVHYYFGSKGALLEAVFLRRAEPANQERLMLLERFEREAGDGALELEKVIEAFVVPAFHTAYDPARGGPVFQSLMGRLYAEGGDILPRIVATHFLPLLGRFASALARALPELPPDELFWRVHFAMGATAQALRGSKDWEIFGSPSRNWAGSELIMQRLMAFLVAAFRAPLFYAGEASAGESAPVLPRAVGQAK
jgi:AcrR family transcriptional regulator